MSNSVKSSDSDVARGVASFSQYSNLVELIYSSSAGSCQQRQSTLEYILDGQASLELERLVPLSVRKQAGIFFTNTGLAEKVARKIAPLLKICATVCDPACGAGNLLIACSKYLPCGGSFEETVTKWTSLIKGIDLFPEFAQAARLRLAFAAASRHPQENIEFTRIADSSLFRMIQLGDIFDSKPISSSKCLVFNSPFGYMLAPDNCTWSQGKIQIAGWLIERLLLNGHSGQHFVFILPDVLNSGTRYKKWRNTVSNLVSEIHIEPAGRFDKKTDIDVFIAHMIVTKRRKSSWPIKDSRCKSKISDYFQIKVGTVVPHRDPIRGRLFAFIHAKTALAWQTVKTITERRRTTRKLFNPPFVAVHRTSSPSDKNRCIATIIDTKTKVAVENHLIVFLPKDRSKQRCYELLNSLRDPRTNTWLNERIRCRHLTTHILSEMPYYANKEV